jgi:hypothetical protein
MLYRFACGHVGRDNESPSRRRMVTAFIRVAEIRSAPVTDSLKSCPDCK